MDFRIISICRFLYRFIISTRHRPLESRLEPRWQGPLMLCFLRAASVPPININNTAIRIAIGLISPINFIDLFFFFFVTNNDTASVSVGEMSADCRENRMSVVFIANTAIEAPIMIIFLIQVPFNRLDE